MAWLIAWALLLAWGCGKESADTKPAFYHWRTRLAPTEAEKGSLKELEAERLYVKYFDIDIDRSTGFPQALAPLEALPQHLPESLEIVPCVFITNRTFQSISPDQTKRLADKVAALIRELHAPLAEHRLAEVQMDCDWTATTQSNYFAFLEHLHKAFAPDSLILSATIRLHQYKFPDQTGTPPVDRGMLMAYNLGDLDDPEEENSIFSLSQLKKYLLPHRQYPLELDVALPIFAWSVLIREGRPIRLLNNIRMAQLEADSLIEKTGSKLAEVRESHYFYGRYLYKGDLLRAESVAPSTLIEAAHLIADALPDSYDRHVAFYHLDTLTIQHYATEQLQAVLSAFD